MICQLYFFLETKQLTHNFIGCKHLLKSLTMGLGLGQIYSIGSDWSNSGKVSLHHKQSMSAKKINTKLVSNLLYLVTDVENLVCNCTMEHAQIVHYNITDVGKYFDFNTSDLLE